MQKPHRFYKENTENPGFILYLETCDLPFIPSGFLNKQLFEEYVQATVITEHAKGHYSGSDGITELPAVLEAIIT